MLAGLGGVVDDLECELEALEESDSISSSAIFTVSEIKGLESAFSFTADA